MVIYSNRNNIPGAQGDMPRGQRFGYIFGDQVRDIGWLLAHELGHGVFTLKHLNESNYAGKSSLGTLPNLMDYTGSTALAAFQWNTMASPAILTGLDSDDASNAGVLKYPRVLTVFIGGAGDKTEFIGAGPYWNMRSVYEDVNRIFSSYKNNQQFQSLYIGYDEAYGEKIIRSSVLQYIDSTVKIHIVGHSLGGWAAAHLSQILTDKGFSVNTLITIDPVGTGDVVSKFSKIYYHYPTVKADYWVNIHSDPSFFDMDVSDYVALLGGQWRPKRIKPTVEYTSQFSHYNAGALFVDKTTRTKSAKDILIKRIQTTLDENE